MAELPAQVVTGVVTEVVTGAVAVVEEAAAMEVVLLLEVVAAGFALAAAVPRWLAAEAAWPRAALAGLKDREKRAWPVWGGKALE
jgi:hypothetical protein